MSDYQPTPERPHAWKRLQTSRGTIHGCRVCGVVRDEQGANDEQTCSGAVRFGPRGEG